MKRCTLIKNISQHLRADFRVNDRTGFDDIGQRRFAFDHNQRASPCLRKALHRAHKLSRNKFGPFFIDLSEFIRHQLASSDILQSPSKFRLKHDDQRNYAERQCAPQDPVQCVEMTDLRNKGNRDQYDQALYQLLCPRFLDKFQDFVHYKSNDQNIDHICNADPGKNTAKNFPHQKFPFIFAAFILTKTRILHNS